MAKHAYRIEMSFVAAMDRFSSELRALFREKMLSSSTTPPEGGQRSQEHEELELYSKSGSFGTSAQVTSYGQHPQPPTNNWGQSQLSGMSPGPTCPAERTTHGPLRALAASLRRSSPTGSVAQQTGPNHAMTAQSDTTCAYLGQIDDAYLMPRSSATTAEPHVQVARQTKPRNDTQQALRPPPTQLELSPQGPRTEEIRRTAKDSLTQGWPKAPSHAKPYPLEEPRNWRDLFPKTF